MWNRKLYSFRSEEAELIRRTLQSIPETAIQRRVLENLSAGGQDFYVGIVVDQDGDASWEIATQLDNIQQWGHNIATVSFEAPRLYQLALEADGDVASERLTFAPDRDKSNWE